MTPTNKRTDLNLNIYNREKMTENTETKYQIIEEDVAHHAPITYNSMQEHYERLNRLGSVIGNQKYAMTIIGRLVAEYGVLPNRAVPYTKDFLENDRFKVEVIHHLCMSNMAGKVLSWEAYVYMRQITEGGLLSGKYENLSAETLTLQAFNVDPQIIPKAYLTRNMKMDEFNKAIELIATEVAKINSFKDFDSYDDYFEYVEEFVPGIEKMCHDAGYYGTHDQERFTCAIISHKLRMPMFDLLYKVDTIKPQMDMDLEQIKSVQAQALDQLYGEGGPLDDDNFDEF